MTDRIVENEQARDMLVKFIQSHKVPFTASIVSGKHRTTRQNRLQRQWIKEIAEQRGDVTAEEIRGYCKLHFGIPILREENEAFRLKYDRMLKPMSYEQKIELMMEPLSFPVTSLMTTKQKTAYLDAVHKHFSEQGIVLTDPGDLLRNQESDPEPKAASGGDAGNGAGSVETPPSDGPHHTPGLPVSDGGTPTEAEARAAGAKARADGMSRKAVPKAYQEEPLLSAWQDGFDTGEAEDREPGAEG